MELINIFKVHSDTLGSDIECILTKACKPASERNCAGHDVTVERVKDLYNYIEHAKGSEAHNHFNDFVMSGFNTLSDEMEWAKLEQELYFTELEQVHTRRGGSILISLMHLARTFFDNQNLSSPCRIYVSQAEKTIDISKMYLYPAAYVIDLKNIFHGVLAKPNGFSKYIAGILHMIRAFSESRNEQIIIKHLENKSVADAIDDNTIFEVLLAKVPKTQQSRLRKFRSAYNPELHGNERKFAGKTSYLLRAGSESRGARWVYEVSPIWFKQCQEHVNHVYQHKGKLAAISTITRLTKLGSAIFDHKKSLINLEQLRKDGISAFFDFKQTLIRALLKIEDSRITDCIGEILVMQNKTYNSDWRLTDLYDFAVAVECDSGDDKYRHIILDRLAQKYPALTKSIFDYALFSLNRIDGEQQSKETVFGQISNIKAIFTSHLELLDSNDHLSLAELGVKALELNNCRIIKRIRSTIKDKFNNKKLELGTAKAMQAAFRLFCSHYGLTSVNSYGVSGKKRRIHESKKSAVNYYTNEEIASIAYAIESGLLDANVTARDELLLRLGRILIKTGWNLSPLLMLEVDDILKLDAPLTGKTAHFVRLFKKRAGYKTQFYEFALDNESIQKEGLTFGAVVTTALADLEYIRDKMSAKLRHELPEHSKLKYRLSLYRDEDGKILSFSYVKFGTWLSEVLRRYECEVAFSVQRIRKAGLNYVYKAYARKFDIYRKAGHHSLKVFVDVYLRDDGLKSEESIASATQTMSDYFAGRPISNEIIIVTEIPANTKQTPSGRCASNGNDDEFHAFKKQQQRLNRDANTTSSQCGDFNACLFCRHFRIVADAEHVWRLLSYHRYVVGEMERGLSNYDNATDQSIYVEELNRRVDTILTELREVSSDAVQGGKLLLETRGCHDDWAFYANLGAQHE